VDSSIATDAGLLIEEVRDSILSLQKDGYVTAVRLANPDCLKVQITEQGRLALSQSRPFLARQDDGHSEEKGSIKIVPKGLRSFDEHDADFFLDLLPGPRRGDGLPESIHFWKTRIEELDPEKTFKIGTVYGPSGCGKSSLVRAGLLPRLSNVLIQVYIEATPAHTESSLLRVLQKRLPHLAEYIDLRTALVDAKEHLTKGRNKLVLVIDQFEQWLQANRGEENTDLGAALRECDGKLVQALVLVRDEFSMTLFRFLEALGIDFKKGENAYVVYRFDLPHARKVLIAFGRAYGRLPEADAELNQDQRRFIDQALAGLSQDGEVVPVRLALFAEMVGELIGGRPWTPTTLVEFGGTEGVGQTFLERTFNSPKDNPKYFVHLRATQAVLSALLPDGGTNMGRRMRSYEELLTASGYAGSPKLFDDLLRILDNETRLITPIEPDESSEECRGLGQRGKRYYQLTHDYLVHSLKDWLTSKQRETSEGRAELLLDELFLNWTSSSRRNRPEHLYYSSMDELIFVLSRVKVESTGAPKMEYLADSVQFYASDLFSSVFASIAERYLSVRSVYCYAVSLILGAAYLYFVEFRENEIAESGWTAVLLRCVVATVLGFVILLKIPPFLRSQRIPFASFLVRVSNTKRPFLQIVAAALGELRQLHVLR
jgi:hypothetical protein